MTNPEMPRLKIHSEEEIDAFLAGDRRSIDRLLLHGMNNLSLVIINHAEREEEIFQGMGSAETVKKRSDWIDAQIVRTKSRTEMMDKVAASTYTWALVAFLGYLAVSAWEYAKNMIKAKLGASS